MKKSCVAAYPVGWPDGRGISGRMRVEWVAGSPWNRWSDAHGMGGQMTVESALRSQDCLFPSRLHTSDHLPTRQYARIVKGWVQAIGLDPAMYGTHTMRRTKASLIYRRTKNLRAVQLLLGHTKLESTVRYLGIEVDDALEMAEQTEV